MSPFFENLKVSGSRGEIFILLGFLMALVLQGIFFVFKLGTHNRYRLALVVAGFLPVIVASIGALPRFTGSTQEQAYFWQWGGILPALGLGFLGSLVGNLILSSFEFGLWEDNAPPDAAIRDAVRQYHQQRIGQPPEMPWGKRTFDLSLAIFGLILSAPLWILCALLIWLEDPGPILFVKNSVGKGGANFRQFKFRTMLRDAEEHTGPVLAKLEDERVLFWGRFLRKSALDELPQLINILRGEMSFVGPRPQRTVLVYGYLREMPEYAERHSVLPGLSGLAQVVGSYYLAPRQKLRFDRLYIRHASLGFDLKLLLLAFLIAFWFRWQKGWDGRLPRSLVRFGSPKRRSENVVA